MKPFPHLRRLFTGSLAVLLLAAATASLPAQKTLTVKPDPPGLAANHRIILKDGTYQLVRKYEVVGDRVRYISIERSGDWEELPADLVDWDATRKWERDHAAQPEDSSDAMKEASAIDKEEAAEREESKARRPEVANGLELPDEDGVFALDTYEGNPELVEMLPSELNANTKSKHGLSTLNPMAKSNASLELDGAHAKVHFHVNDPVLYLSLNARDDAEEVVSHAITVNTSGAKEVASRKHGAHSVSSGFAIVRVDERRAIRIVGAIHMSPNGTVTQDEDIIPAKVDVLPGKHWLKITPSQQLTIGEYALVEIISSSDINQSVWDFRIDPQLGDNQGSLGPIYKQ
jgi:flagellar motor protein MotB